jgi:serine/threonine-protein kinase RsbW
MQAGPNSPSWQPLTLRSTDEVAGCINALLDALRPLDYPERDLFGVRLALEEALINSIRHGHRNDAAKTVRMRFQATEQQMLVEIEDEGPGFDPEGVPDPLSPENLEKPGGRGVFLMRHYMTWVSFNESGNCVTMCYCRSPLAT